MKTVLPQSTFTFDPIAKTLDFTAYPNFNQERLYAVINISNEQKLIYAVASYAQGFGGSFAGDVLTLTYDTSAMSGSDVLQIIYDSDSETQNVEVTNFPATQTVAVSSSVLPTGASTASLQTSGNSSLSSIDGKLTSTVNGLKVDGSDVTQPISGSVSVSNFPALQPVSASSLPLPSGASTEATLSALNAKVTAVNTNSVAITSPLPAGTNALGTVSVSNLPATQPVSAVALPLPSGASTEATLSALSGKVTKADTDHVTISSALPAGTNTIGKVDVNGTVPVSGSVTVSNFPASQDSNLHDGAGTAITSTLTGGKQALDVNFAGGTVSVTATNASIGSTGSPVPASATLVAGSDGTNLVGFKVSTTGNLLVDGSAHTQPVSVVNSKGQFVRLNYAVTSVTTSAYTQLVASTSLPYSKVEIFDSSGETLIFAIGSSGSEVDQFLIFPGGNGQINFVISSGSRISIKALSANATSGEVIINFYV